MPVINLATPPLLPIARACAFKLPNIQAAEPRRYCMGWNYVQIKQKFEILRVEQLALGVGCGMVGPRCANGRLQQWCCTSQPLVNSDSDGVWRR